MSATLHNLDEMRELRLAVQRQADIHARVAPRNEVPTLDEIRNAENIMFAKGEDGRMLASSKGYRTLTGVSSDAYEGLDDVDVWGEDGQRFADNDAFVRMTGSPLQVVEFWMGKDGIPQEGEILKVPYKYGDKIGTLGRVLRDTLRFLTMDEYRARQRG